MTTTTKKKEVPMGFFFRESDHSYFLNGKRMTGCTTILGVINKPALIGWAARMSVEYIQQNLSYKRMKLLRKGYVIFKEKLFEEAKTAHTRKRDDAAEKGTDLHSMVENLVKRSIRATGGYITNDLLGEEDREIEKFIGWAQKNNIKFLASEAQLYSEKLWAAGTADLIFEKDGKRYVGDVKTYAKLWDRTPMLQCAGYALMAEEMGEPKFDGYCILRLGKDGTFEEKWSYDVEGDTRGFLAAAELYRTLSNW